MEETYGTLSLFACWHIFIQTNDRLTSFCFFLFSYALDNFRLFYDLWTCVPHYSVFFAANWKFTYLKFQLSVLVLKANLILACKELYHQLFGWVIPKCTLFWHISSSTDLCLHTLHFSNSLLCKMFHPRQSCFSKNQIPCRSIILFLYHSWSYISLSQLISEGRSRQLIWFTWFLLRFQNQTTEKKNVVFGHIH